MLGVYTQRASLDKKDRGVEGTKESTLLHSGLQVLRDYLEMLTSREHVVPAAAWVQPIVMVVAYSKAMGESSQQVACQAGVWKAHELLFPLQ